MLQHINQIGSLSDRASTNTAAQWSLNAIEILEMLDGQLPEEVPNN